MQTNSVYTRAGALFLPLTLPLTLALLFTGCTRAAKEARFLSRADDYYKAGQYDEANIEYLNLLRLDPVNPTPYLRIGEISFENGDTLKALQFLSKARDLAPDNREAHARLGSIYLALGDAAAARKEALAMLKQAPGDGEALLMLVNAVRAPADIQSAAQQLKNFPNQQSVSFQLASAGLLFRQGDRPGGDKAVRQALTLDPQSYAAHLAMADIFMVQKDPQKAEEEYKTAADLSPPRGDARLRYAQFELQSGAVDKARDILADISAKTPDYLPAWIVQAQIAASQKKPDEALSLVAHVLARDPADLDARVLQAEIWLAKGDTKSAIADLQLIADSDGSPTIVKYQLARAYVQNGDTVKALAALNQVIAVSPDYTDAVLLQATLNLRAGTPRAAIAPLLRLLKIRPGLDSARLLLTDAYRASKQFDDAIAMFQKQIQKNPNDTQSLFLLGITFLDKGSTPEARATFEKLQQLTPNDLATASQLVDLDLTAKDFDSAIKRVQLQIAAQPKSAGAQYLLGKIYVAEMDWPHAGDALTKALAQDPDLSVASELLASIYITQGKSDKAISQLQTFLVKHPTDTRSLMLLAGQYESANQPQKARDTYEQLLSTSPDFVPALNNLAGLYAMSDHTLDKARGLAERARTLAPDNLSVADTLGWILYARGDYRQALALLTQSASKAPVAPEVLFHLGMADYMMDYPDAARTALHQAMDSPTDFPGKADIPSRLAVIEQNQYAQSSPDQLEAIVKQQPGDLYAQMALGDAWKRKGDPVKAAASYEQALAGNPNLLSACLNLAELNAGPLHNPDKAFDLAKKARELAPTDSRAAGILGAIAYRKGDFLRAFGLLQEAINATTDDAGASSILQAFAWTAYSQGKIPEARSAMQRIVAAAPSSPEAQDAASFLALTNPEQNADPRPALEPQISKILQLTPDYAPALMARARLRMKSGDPHGAQEDYAAVLRHFPAHRNISHYCSFKIPRQRPPRTTSPSKPTTPSRRTPRFPKCSPRSVIGGRTTPMPSASCGRAPIPAPWIPNPSTIWACRFGKPRRSRKAATPSSAPSTPAFQSPCSPMQIASSPSLRRNDRAAKSPLEVYAGVFSTAD
jgi:tetratricopeptide (TPR) repeat protein